MPALKEIRGAAREQRRVVEKARADLASEEAVLKQLEGFFSRGESGAKTKTKRRNKRRRSTASSMKLVMEYLKAHSDRPMNRYEIHQATGASYAAVGTAISAGLANGSIRRAGVVRRGTREVELYEAS